MIIALKYFKKQKEEDTQDTTRKCGYLLYRHFGGEFYSSFLLLYLFKNEMSTLKFVKISSNLSINETFFFFVFLYPSSLLPRAHTPDPRLSEGRGAMANLLSVSMRLFIPAFHPQLTLIFLVLFEGAGSQLGEKERQRRKSYPNWT